MRCRAVGDNGKIEKRFRPGHAPPTRSGDAVVFSLLVCLALSAEPFQPTRIALPPTADTLGAAMAAVEAQSGLQFLRTAGDLSVPVRDMAGAHALWPLVAKLSGGMRIRLDADGRRVAFVTGLPAAAAIDGAFRLAVRGVTCRHDYNAGPPVCEVALDLHWEPRLAVVRVADGSGGKAAVTDARHATTVRLADVQRSAAKLPALDVAFTVTAAERLLTFTVPDLAAPKPQTQAGVTLTPQPPRRLGAVLELRLDLRYPEGHPEFESFESWTANNRCRLAHRDGRTLEPRSFDETPNGRAVAVAYRFNTAEVGDLAGWSLVYDTPGPLREFAVRFKLLDIPLP